MTLGRLRLSSVALIAVLFFLSMLAYTLYSLASLQSELRQDVGENMVWASSQGVYQSGRLALVALRQPRTAADDVEQHMRREMLAANLLMLAEGPQRRYMERSGVLADISRAADMLEQPRVDYLALLQLLQHIGNKVMLSEREIVGLSRDRHQQLLMQVMLSVLGILLAGSILCVQLLGSLKRVRVASEEISRQHEQARTLLDALQQERSARLRYRDFVSLMSHQLRTPLAVIDSSAQRLLRQSPEPEVTQRVQRMRNSVRQLNALIGRVLEGVRRDDDMAGGTRASSLELHAHDWRSVVSEALARLDEMLSSRSVSVDWHEMGTGPVPISCDRLWCVEILCNLLSNAHKYSPDGSPIELAVQVRDEHLYCTVRDFGPGLASEDRERVFERFYRAQGTRSIAGTGLGLSIAQALAQWHGGTLSVCNAEGGGALFTLVLPLSTEP